MVWFFPISPSCHNYLFGLQEPPGVHVGLPSCLPVLEGFLNPAHRPQTYGNLRGLAVHPRARPRATLDMRPGEAAGTILVHKDQPAFTLGGVRVSDAI